MENKKLPIIACIGLLLFGGLGFTPIYASDEIDRGELLDEFDSMKGEVNGLFDSMKEKYTNLANNYGNIEIPDADKVYQDYLNQVQQGKEELKIEEKLEDIRNTDLSVDNSEMKAEYQQAKKDAANKLTDAKLNSDAIVDKFQTIQQEQSEKEKQLEQERIKAAETKYNNIVDGYYETLNKKPDALPGIPAGTGSFNASTLHKLSLSMGIDYYRAIASGSHNILENAVIYYNNTVSKNRDFNRNNRYE